MVPLRLHRDWEEFSDFRMLNEKVRIEEQRNFISIHGYLRKAVLKPQDIHKLSLSGEVPREILLKCARGDIGQLTDICGRDAM
jgi:hypothetical protein